MFNAIIIIKNLYFIHQVLPISMTGACLVKETVRWQSFTRIFTL